MAGSDLLFRETLDDLTERSKRLYRAGGAEDFIPFFAINKWMCKNFSNGGTTAFSATREGDATGVPTYN